MTVAKRSLRIFALPLSKQTVTNTSTGHGRAVLNTYYHFVTAPPPNVIQGKPGLISRATDMATNTWDGWGKAAPGTWKVYSPPCLSLILKGLTSLKHAEQGVQLRRTTDRQARFRRTGVEELRPIARPENHQPPDCRKRRAATTSPLFFALGRAVSKLISPTV